MPYDEDSFHPHNLDLRHLFTYCKNNEKNTFKIVFHDSVTPSLFDVTTALALKVTINVINDVHKISGFKK